jgi:thiol:disulfide interchange protein DsbD
MTGTARRVGLMLLACLPLACSDAVAGPPEDDPFADSNAATAAPKAAAERPGTDRTADLLRLEGAVEPGVARPGQVVRLTITGKLKPGYHTYPLTLYSEDPAQGPGGLNQLLVEKSAALRPLAPLNESEPEFIADKAGGVLLEYAGTFIWSQDVLILPDAPPGEHELAVLIKLQVCDENKCTPGERRLSVPVRVAGNPIAVTPELEKRLAEPMPPPKTVAVPADLRGRMSKPVALGEMPTGADSAQTAGTGGGGATGKVRPHVGIVQQLGFAVFQGFIMLLTPCVFPMIPVTVSLFLKEGEKEHHNPLALATVYSMTIFLVLTFAVLVLGKFIVDWANNVWLNLGMGLLLLYFALSLFGMYDIGLPGFLTRFTVAREGRGGYVGAFFMALTFTVNSFTCTGPFLGPLLSGIKELRLTVPELVANAAAYSAGFAAPFFVLALFPRLLKALPKSGGWLNSTKVVMAFVEVALALKFLSITDAGLHPGDPRYFNYETVLCMWMALSVACGIYLLGVFRLPHDSPVQSVGVLRLMLATFFLGFAVYMTPLLGRRTPQGPIGEFLHAWLPQDRPPEFAPAGPSGPESAATNLAWQSDYEAGWSRAKKEGKLLFIDFTGVNCQNCRYNEGNVFPRPEVRGELAKFVLVRLYTDQVPDPRLTDKQAHQEALRNRGWQEATFADISLPLYVVLDPTGAATPVTADGKLDGAVRGQASGTISNVGEFVAVLRNAQGKQVARSD